MDQVVWLPITVALGATIIGAVTDVWRFRVYNALTIPLLLTGFCYHTVMQGWSGVSASLSGACFGFAILIVPYMLGMMGAGDVKLMAGVGAWLGLPVTIVVFVLSALVTGLYAMILILWRGKPHESWATMKLIFYRCTALGTQFSKDDLVEEMFVKSDRRLRIIPFGAMIPLGVLGAALWIVWIRSRGM